MSHYNDLRTYLDDVEITAEQIAAGAAVARHPARRRGVGRRFGGRVITPLDLGGDCAGHPHPDWWYANPGTQQWRDAKAICAGCPMTVACYATALMVKVARISAEVRVWASELDQRRML